MILKTLSSIQIVTEFHSNSKGAFTYYVINFWPILDFHLPQPPPPPLRNQA